LHLSIFNGNLFELHQVDSVFRSFWRRAKSECDLIKRKIFISSEKSNLLELGKCKSFMNNKNNNGARWDPWGTSYGMLKGAEWKFFNLTISILSVK
jgi:hypothetical protein